MSEQERRRGYNPFRVLIESARVLDSDLADSLICLSGGEQELLRNLMQYLHQLDSFVETYAVGYYLVPDTADWDDIQSAVACLEEKLMGCAEIEAMLEGLLVLATPIAKNERQVFAAGVSGTEVKYITAPAEWFHRKVHSILCRNTTRIGGDISIGYHKAAGNTTLHTFSPTVTGEFNVYSIPFELSYPDSVYVVFTGCQENDSLTLFACQTDIEMPS